MTDIIPYIVLGVIGLAILAVVVSFIVSFLPQILMVCGILALIVLVLPHIPDISGVVSDVGKKIEDVRPAVQKAFPKQLVSRTPAQQQFHDEVLDNTSQKSGVNLTTLRPELDSAIAVIIRVYQDFFDDPNAIPVITSADDYDGHKENSAHYDGAAIDLRLKDIPDRDQREMLTVAVREALDSRFFVDHESPGRANEHMHIQLRKAYYNPKVAYR